jgi:hypothetical protein
LLSEAIGLKSLPDWQEGLGQFVQEISQKHAQTGNFHR